VGERNDVIRGLPGDYAKATETLRRLKELRLPNLTVGLHSVISSHNVRDFPAIADSLMAMKPDQYIAEPAEERVELQTIGTGITPKPALFDPAIAHLEGRLRNGSGDGLPRLTRAIRLVYYRLARRTLRENRQVIPCYAAIASVHLAANGDVWGCCTKAKPLGNLRRNGFDFDAIWRSQEAGSERADIKAGKCACPLANAAYTSILCDAGALVQVGRNLVRPGKGAA
jgi:MoaA/NifB/PqqE/SkfB family radical SAM enzyme